MTYLDERVREDDSRIIQSYCTHVPICAKHVETSRRGGDEINI